MQKGIASYLQNGLAEPGKEDLFADITLYHVPASLVKEFALKIACRYPGGISEAIQDLMKSVLKE
jgi:hypothetical protein